MWTWFQCLYLLMYTSIDASSEVKPDWYCKVKQSENDTEILNRIKPNWPPARSHGTTQSTMAEQIRP